MLGDSERTLRAELGATPAQPVWSAEGGKVPVPPTPAIQRRTLLGIAALCLGIAVFSIQDPMIKHLSATYPVTEALVIRAVVALPILLWLVHRETGLRSIASKHVGFLTVRGLLLFISYAGYYLAVAAMPLADAIALFFVAPLFIVTLAVPYLGERIPWQSLAGVLIGLVGVVVMLRPGSGLFEWAALLSLLAALLYAIPQLMARKVSNEISAPVMTFYQNALYFFGSLLVAGFFAIVGPEGVTHPSLAFLTRPWVWPTPIDFAMMAACGLIASAGMTLLSQAYRLAPANRVAAFEYTGILWTPLWGFLFFTEIPQFTTVVGAVLVVAAGLIALGVQKPSTA